MYVFIYIYVYIFRYMHDMCVCVNLYIIKLIELNIKPYTDTVNRLTISISPQYQFFLLFTNGNHAQRHRWKTSEDSKRHFILKNKLQ